MSGLKLQAEGWGGGGLRVGVTALLVSPGFLFCGLKFRPGRLAKNSGGSASSSLKDVARNLLLRSGSWRRLNSKPPHRDGHLKKTSPGG